MCQGTLLDTCEISVNKLISSTFMVLTFQNGRNKINDMHKNKLAIIFKGDKCFGQKNKKRKNREIRNTRDEENGSNFK